MNWTRNKARRKKLCRERSRLLIDNCKKMREENTLLISRGSIVNKNGKASATGPLKRNCHSQRFLSILISVPSYCSTCIYYCALSIGVPCSARPIVSFHSLSAAAKPASGAHIHTHRHTRSQYARSFTEIVVLLFLSFTSLYCSHTARGNNIAFSRWGSRCLAGLEKRQKNMV